MRPIEELTFEEFINLYVRENLSLDKIGRIFGVSRQRIHQIKKYFEKIHGKIQRTQSLDPFTLKRFLDEGKDVKEISSLTNLKISKINRMIRKYEDEYKQGVSPIKIVRRKSKDILPKSLLYQLYAKELLTDKEIGLKFDLSSVTVWMLRKEYGIESLYTKSLRRA